MFLRAGGFVVLALVLILAGVAIANLVTDRSGDQLFSLIALGLAALLIYPMLLGLRLRRAPIQARDLLTKHEERLLHVASLIAAVFAFSLLPGAVWNIAADGPAILTLFLLVLMLLAAYTACVLVALRHLLGTKGGRGAPG